MRVLVTGVGGLIGSNVAAAAAQQSWEVLGGFRDAPVEIDGVRTAGWEMADRRACVEATMGFEPDVVVHAAGGVALTRFERDPYIAQVDFVGTEHTLAAARAVRARYVLVSCDLVHSGYRPAGLCFSESDLPDPVNAYGRSKLACEEATMRSNVRWLITRPADVYGVNLGRPVDWDTRPPRLHPPDLHPPDHRPSRLHPLYLHPPGDRPPDVHRPNPRSSRSRARYVWERSGLALRLVRRLRDRTALPAPAGVQRSPTYAWDYAQRLCELIAQGCEGIYNLAGPSSLGRYEWVGLLADGLGCSRALVREGTTAAFLQACGEDPRLKLPQNTALSDEKARAAIGSPAVAPERGVELMREQLCRTLEPAGPRAR
jgi:dTDP-4-dehydrorhamnose reductase